MKAKQVVERFMAETGVQDPEELLDILYEWFDEHDATEGLSEYLAFVTEGRARRRD